MQDRQDKCRNSFDSKQNGLLDLARERIQAYLQSEFEAGRIAENYFQEAIRQVFPNLKRWVEDPNIDRLDPNVKPAILDTISAGNWELLVNAFVRDVKFGTGGIREKMAFDRDSILRLKAEGIRARILKGPNTINDIVLLLTSLGVAQYGRSRHSDTDRVPTAVVGFDSRIQGESFARLVARLFLTHQFRVYLFDEACLYPEVTFAVPTLRADVGVFISASHNDYRYNGYKLSCGNGSQFELKERDVIYSDYITQAKPAQVELTELTMAGQDQLCFLGGDKPLPGVDYCGREDKLIDLHTQHINHVKKFLLRDDLLRGQRINPKRLQIAYSAFHGSGRRAVPRLLEEVGFVNVRRIMHLDPLDGMFPCFSNEPGKEQQPDPGDPRAAEIAVNYFKEEYPDEWNDLDLIIGTDPDADRCGVVVKVPPEERHLHDGSDHYLLPADDAWALVLWYRLEWRRRNSARFRSPRQSSWFSHIRLATVWYAWPRSTG